MAAKHYLVAAGLRRVVLVAESATDAKAVAKAAFSGDTNTAWDTATVTQLAAAAGADMTGWRLNVKVDTSADVEVYNETVVGEASDTMDDLAAAMVTALETAGGASLTPSYSTPDLTIATIGDGIGDHKVYVTVTPPATWEDPNIAIPGMVGAIVDEGIAGAVLTAALVPTNSIPVITEAFSAPAAADVEAAVEYGVVGSETTGTFVVPAEADVEADVEFGNSAEFTGTFVVPAEADVEAGVEFGDSAEFTGTFVVPAEADVEAGVEFGDSAEFTGTFVVPAEADVEAGVEFGDSAEFTGTLAVDNNAFSIIVPDSTIMPAADHVNSVVVAASSSADALAMAKAMSGMDLDARWDTAAVAETAAAVEMEDWTLTATVTAPAGVVLYSETITGGNGDVLADLAGDLVTALETAGGASLTPSYDSGTGILTVAAIADGIGDHVLTVQVHSPLSDSVAIPGFITTIVDEGAAAAVLTAQLINDNLIPAIILRSDRRE